MTTNQDYEDADDQQGFADLREGRYRRITPEVLLQEQDAASTGAKTWATGSNDERDRIARAVPVFLYTEGHVLRNLGDIADYLNALEAKAGLLNEARKALVSIHAAAGETYKQTNVAKEALARLAAAPTEAGQ